MKPVNPASEAGKVCGEFRKKWVMRLFSFQYDTRLFWWAGLPGCCTDCKVNTQSETRELQLQRWSEGSLIFPELHELIIHVVFCFQTDRKRSSSKHVQTRRLCQKRKRWDLVFQKSQNSIYRLKPLSVSSFIGFWSFFFCCCAERVQYSLKNPCLCVCVREAGVNTD